MATGIIAGADVNNMATSFFSSSSNTGESISTAFSGNFSSFFDLRSLLESANLNSTLTGVIIYAVDNTYSVVNSSGVQILFSYPALQSIPSSAFEASKVEGRDQVGGVLENHFPDSHADDTRKYSVYYHRLLYKSEI